MKTRPSCWPKVLLPTLLITVVAFSLSQGTVSAVENCGEYGTTVEFADSVTEAAKQAIKEQKLVFVLHVSGHFEDSDFT